MNQGTVVKIFAGSSLLLVAVFVSQRGIGAFSGLGDEGEGRVQSKRYVFNRYVAKKFYGTSVLAAQGHRSMTLLKEATAGDAKAQEHARLLAEKLAAVAQLSLRVGGEYDQKWIRWKLAAQGQEDALEQRADV